MPLGISGPPSRADLQRTFWRTASFRPMTMAIFISPQTPTCSSATPSLTRTVCGLRVAANRTMGSLASSSNPWVIGIVWPISRAPFGSISTRTNSAIWSTDTGISTPI